MPEPREHISFARLVDWSDGRLPADEARTVEEAVSRADDETLADVAWLRKFRAATGSAVHESPPQELRDALLTAFDASIRGRRKPGFVVRAFAHLTFDSNLQPAAGIRTIGARQSRRQLIYRADDFDLAINLLARGSDNSVDLDGQVLPREGEESMLFSVQLLENGRELALSAVEEMGSFAFQRVPPGSYELVLSAARTEVSIEPFEVGL